MDESFDKPMRVLVAVLAALLLANCAGAKSAKYYPPPAPGSYFTVTVQSGDTVSGIAERYAVRQDDLVAFNRISDRDRLYTGEMIRVPAYGRRWAGNTIAPRPQPRPQQTASAVPVPKPAQRPASGGWFSRRSLPPAQTAGRQDVLSRDGRFLWPVNGPVLSAYGQHSNGERNDGINISAAHGAPIHAAAEGTVTYVGNELKGYGNLVLIRHDNGYVTAYAHADSVAVQRGDRVHIGQIIAYAGATGDVNEPQLHFEIRQGTRPIDPRPYLVTSL